MTPPNELLDHIAQQYNLSAIQSVNPVTAGFLSENHLLQGDQATFFLKQYRFTEWQRVAAAHQAKFFFAQENIPVILPIRSRSGETFFAFAEKYYSVFPFVEGNHLPRGCFSLAAIESTATMLATIHKAGRSARPTFVRISKTQRNYAHFFESAQRVMSKIPAQGRTAFDELATACVALKLRLARQNEAAIAEISLASDHLIHGDYQDANLFFDEDEQVSHVFDWEKTEIAPRGLELVRAIEFICFSNSVDYKALFTDENYEKARHFLQSYHHFYPIPQQELSAAWHVRYLYKILSLWVEEDHYLENNQRVDVFLESEYNAVQYYSHALSEHIERLRIDILA